jgi:hypothetical protein
MNADTWPLSAFICVPLPYDNTAASRKHETPLG